MYTVRLNIENASPLDGVTPLALSESSVRTQDGKSNHPQYFGEDPTNILTVNLPPSFRFGLFDPGEVIEQRNKNLRLISLTVTPGIATGFALGDIVQLVAPEGSRSDLVDLARQRGVYNLLDQVIPVDHKIAFNTETSAAEGPYRIDMTFIDITKPDQFFGGDS